VPPEQAPSTGSMTIPQLRAALMSTYAPDQRAALIRQVARLKNAGLWDGPIPPLHHQDGLCGICGLVPGQCAHQGPASRSTPQAI
jgi:hypothetical protein